MTTKRSLPSKGSRFNYQVEEVRPTSTLDRWCRCRLGGLGRLPSSCRLPPTPRCLPALSELLNTVLPSMAHPPSDQPPPSLLPPSPTSKPDSLDSVPRQDPWPPLRELGLPPCPTINHRHLSPNSSPSQLPYPSIIPDIRQLLRRCIQFS